MVEVNNCSSCSDEVKGELIHHQCLICGASLCIICEKKMMISVSTDKSEDSCTMSRFVLCAGCYEIMHLSIPQDVTRCKKQLSKDLRLYIRSIVEHARRDVAPLIDEQLTKLVEQEQE